MFSLEIYSSYPYVRLQVRDNIGPIILFLLLRIINVNYIYREQLSAGVCKVVGEQRAPKTESKQVAISFSASLTSTHSVPLPRLSKYHYYCLSSLLDADEFLICLFNFSAFYCCGFSLPFNSQRLIDSAAFVCKCEANFLSEVPF